ncbi:hypothetical protein GBAR_LOCUS13975 [Geodia barretti]|uniref:Uncharacterized protein n=1 Tax=Geodia barretti TaxID=519541 RepID=A0AA35S8B2_GEOBA|nr:hypothetical protein GBAR_LOCUS13975 [Geodia barretti]
MIAVQTITWTTYTPNTTSALGAPSLRQNT